MRLVSVFVDGQRRAGWLEEDRVFFTDVPGLEAAIEAGTGVGRKAEGWLPAAEARLDAPVRPPVVLCAGQNYRDHLDEKAPVEVTEPEFFLKAGQTIAAPDEPCLLDPRVTAKLDYETELGVVIGRAGRHIPPERATEHILGYLVLNDLTARDRQVVKLADGGFGLALGPGKNFDGATRFASSIVTSDEVPHPQGLELRTWVSDELRQRNTTASMIFGVGEIVAYLSRLLTLRPGTVIATGTPGGTGWGADRSLGGTGRTPAGCSPARYLAPGDVVASSVEGVGELRFEVEAYEHEPPLADRAASSSEKR